ncbi:hypothetical protein ACWATR_36930 [Nostoc sp. UIC 10890]
MSSDLLRLVAKCDRLLKTSWDRSAIALPKFLLQKRHLQNSNIL